MTVAARDGGVRCVDAGTGIVSYHLASLNQGNLDDVILGVFRGHFFAVPASEGTVAN